uniref:Uncharacterized protein n=1 Tax=Micrurus corallinus TaxID=54390 RepID=A0A2D4GBD2_MICCO
MHGRLVKKKRGGGRSRKQIQKKMQRMLKISTEMRPDLSFLIELDGHPVRKDSWKADFMHGNCSQTVTHIKMEGYRKLHSGGKDGEGGRLAKVASLVRDETGSACKRLETFDGLFAEK